MDTFGSILRRIKYPAQNVWPGNIRTRVSLRPNYKEFSIERNLMTGLPEGLIDDRGAREALPLFLKGPKFSHRQEIPKIYWANRYIEPKDFPVVDNYYFPLRYRYFEEGKYRVGFLAPRNYHAAPLYYNTDLYHHIPNPNLFFHLPLHEMDERREVRPAPTLIPSHTPS